MHKSEWPSKQAIQNFELVAKIAQVIGLADCPPKRSIPSPYINNSPLKKTRVRKCNQSDIIPIERQLQSQRIRSKHSSRQNHTLSETKSFRKGAIVDIFVNSVKPQEDPLIVAKNKKIILRSDLARARKQALQRDHIQKIAINKSQRSKILNQISEEMIIDFQPKAAPNNQEYWFKEYRKSKPMKSHSFSQQKLAASLDLNKFRLISKKGDLLLKSRECRSQLRSQTASGGRRRLINMQFNGNNKVEIVYPLCQSRAEL